MKIISWNLNGLMACIKNDVFAPFHNSQPDFLCFQEIRTKQTPVVIHGYNHYWNAGEQDGYSGTAVLSKQKPIKVLKGLGAHFPDTEGRVITIELPMLYLVNTYVPNSQKNLKRHAYRLEWDNSFRAYISDLKENKPVIICGDFNTTLSAIDVYEENEKQYWEEQGFASDERSNLETLLDLGFYDAFRVFHPDERCYTWWSTRLQKREQNRGWRLDYFLVSEELIDKVTSVQHLSDIYGSDHCPIELEVSL